MSEIEEFKKRDDAYMTRLQCLHDWVDLCKVILCPETILKEDIDVYRQELEHLTSIFNVLFISAESETLNQIDY